MRTKGKTAGQVGSLLAMGACAAWLLSAAGCSMYGADDDGGAYEAPAPNGPGAEPPQGSNVSFGGSQDVGFLRGQLEAGLVPSLDALDDAGFFAEHHLDLPPPRCGERICLQPMVAVMGNLVDGSPCTMLHLALKSPIVADASQRPPLDLAVVVDVSGSMQGDKLAYVQDGLQLLIDSMRDGDRLALIAYSDLAELRQPLAPVADRRVELRASVRELIADGGTNLAAGLETGYQALSEALEAGREQRVILLSDGNPTQGITDTPSILALSRGYNSEGIGLSTIGLGSDFNIELMRGLSQQADGNYYFVEDAGAVNEVFGEELDFFVVPVAFDLQLSLQAGEHYDFGRAYGAPAWRDTERGGALEIPSVILAHRKAASDVTADDGRRGGGSSLLVELFERGDVGEDEDLLIAGIDLEFRDPIAGALVRDHVELRKPAGAAATPSEAFVQADALDAAHKSFLMLNIFVGIENAVTEFHEGSASEQTIAELDALIDAVRDYDEEIQDTDIELDLELLDMLRDNLVRAGVPTRERTPSEDPWPHD